jgi:hypothetical protein
VHPDNAGHQQRWRRWSAVTLGVVAIGVVSFAIYFFAFAFTSQDCSVGFDTSTVPPPANASPQGWLCSDDASTLGPVIWTAGFLVGWVVTVVLIAWAWRRWSWRGGLPALALIFLGPYLTTWVMNLPPDDCTAHTRSTHPAGDCSRG